MGRWWLVSFAGFVVSSLAGCAPVPGIVDAMEEPTEEGDDAISNAEESDDAPQIMQIERVGGGRCSSTMLTRHYLLTAAHCAPKDGSFADVAVRWVDPKTEEVETIYEGEAFYYVHPSYEGAGKYDNDMAVVYLFDGADEEWRGRLYADSREPWKTSYQGSREFSVIGWGRGSDAGSATACPEDGGGVKRRSDGWQVVPTDVAKPKQTAGTNATQEICKGDSGTSWLLSHKGKLLTFAVHGGGTGTEHASLVAPKLSWIESVLGSDATCKTYKTSDGYAYRRCEEY